MLGVFQISYGGARRPPVNNLFSIDISDVGLGLFERPVCRIRNIGEGPTPPMDCEVKGRLAQGRKKIGRVY